MCEKCIEARKYYSFALYLFGECEHCWEEEDEDS